MIRITQLRLPVHHTDSELKDKIIKTLRIRPQALESYRIAKRSLDARDKGNIIYSYTIDVTLTRGSKPGRKVDGREIMYYEPREYRIPVVSSKADLPHDGSPQGDLPYDGSSQDDLCEPGMAGNSGASINAEADAPEVLDKAVYTGTGRIPPVIVGCGPAGLFAGLALARAGLFPVILERGEDAVSRKHRVEHFWETGELDTSSNVCFGEGGAGTFSDGKLNTLVKDPDGRHAMVLKTFVEFGADPSIMYDQKPHIGTDKLIEIITAMRREIERLGGQIYFNAEVTDLITDDTEIREVIVKKRIRHGSSCSSPMIYDKSSCRINEEGETNHSEKCTSLEHVSEQMSSSHEHSQESQFIVEQLPCRELILAIGHSARDTFSILKNRGLCMQPKAFAVGLRIQHPQHMIDVSQFGEKEADFLSPAAYKLTGRAKNGRGVYSFCMCPGGYVVNASTEPGMLTVNGMSYSGRDSGTANSALIVTVTPEDFVAYARPDMNAGAKSDTDAAIGYDKLNRFSILQSDADETVGTGPADRAHTLEPHSGDKSGANDPLLGIYFQRELERAAFNECKGKIPVQLLGDYLAGRASTGFGGVEPRFKGASGFGRLDTAFPSFIKESIADVMPGFGRKIKGFDRKDAILAGIEGRTSSPVRIVRDENGLSNVGGIYPCGEGAGYAGGITSAAMDGLLAAERIIARYL